ncbi:MAG: hypothetical protein ACP5OC_08690, partial [Thermoplasmata archaeon]
MTSDDRSRKRKTFELTVESCHLPNGPYTRFLEEAILQIEIKNSGKKDISVEEVEVRFQTEGDFPQYTVKAKSMFLLKREQRELVSLSFIADLSMLEGTNVYTIWTTYKVSGNKTSVKCESQCQSLMEYPVIYPTRKTDKYFFISHKIPENTPLAEALSKYINKVGFEAFLAEHNLTPGLNLWEDKIKPAIRNSACLGAIILWTLK